MNRLFEQKLRNTTGDEKMNTRTITSSLGSLAVAALCIALSGLVAGPALAQTTYTYTQNAGGTQSWTNDANWSGSAPSPVAGDTIQANLTMSAATFLNLGDDRTFEVWTSNFGGFGSSAFTINSGYTITLAGTTPTITHNGKGSVTMENILAGTAGLKKNGSQTLVLNNPANSFSGGIELAAGILAFASDAALGDVGNDITVTGNSRLHFSTGMTINRDVTLGSGTTLNFQHVNASTIAGAVTGDGGISMTASGFGSYSLTLSSTGNNFTGSILVGYDKAPTLAVNSLADSANPLELKIGNKGDTKFVYGSGAVAPLSFGATGRQLVLSGNQTRNHVIENANADAANTISISKDLSITSTTSRKLILQGINTGPNTIGGIIPDGASGGITSLEKNGAGTWVLAGGNTYTGPTTVSAGTLVIDGGSVSQCLPDTNLLTITSPGKLQLNAGVREKVGSLKLGAGATIPGPTSYGSSASSAENKDNTYFAGTGVLYVGMDIPASGTVIMFR